MLSLAQSFSFSSPPIIGLRGHKKEKERMKHSTVFVIGLVLVIFLFGTSAMMQQDTANQLRDAQQIATSNAIEDAYISNNTWHKTNV